MKWFAVGLLSAALLIGIIVAMVLAKTSRLQWDEAGGPRWDFRGAVHDFVLRAHL